MKQRNIPSQSPSKFRDYCTLTKPEVNLLVLMTTSAGYYLAQHPVLHVAGLMHTLVGTLLVASGTATLNQWMESTWDARMRRTAQRPVPAGRITAREAFQFGLLLSAAGGIYLAFFVNSLTALLAMFTLLSYLLVYTPLKRKTALCTLIGAIPGAMPVLIGCAGALSGIATQTWYLFAIVFLWQFPHFLAIALMYREDYERAGYKMLPALDRDGRFTRGEIIAFTVVLIATTILPFAHNSAGCLTGVLMAGTFLLYHVIKLANSTSGALAGRLLHASVIYLPIVLGVLVVHK